MKPILPGLRWQIAWRYLRGRRSRLLDGTARSALAANALGVLAMVIAMALMTGYREELVRKLIGGNAAVVAYPLAPRDGGAAALPPAQRALLRQIPGVQSVDPVAYGQGTLTSAKAPEGVGVTVRGVEAESAAGPGGDSLRSLGGAPMSLGSSSDGLPAAVLGEELAQRLGAARGDLLRLVALGFRGGVPRFNYATLRVSGTFATGFSEFDRSWLVMDRARLEQIAGSGGSSELLEFRLEDPATAPEVAERAARLLGNRYLVTSWQEMNRELFTALRVQQIALFLVLGLIVLVSTFNIASTLVVLVRERMRDIGVLGAMGLAPAELRAVFLIYGGLLGAVGTALGLLIGGGAAWTLNHFELIRFDADVAAIYFIRSVPFRVDPRDLLAIAVFAGTVNLLACLAPAWRAGRIEPAVALRYE